MVSGLLRLLTLIFIVFYCWQSHAVEKVTFCENNIPPFTIVGKEYVPGNDILSRFITEVFSRIDGYESQLLIYPWKRCLHMVQNGAIDGAVMVYKSKKREAFFDFSDAFLIYQEAVFYNMDKHPHGVSWSSFKDLDGLRIGLLHGFFYHQEVEEKIQLGTLIPDRVHKSEFNYIKLYAGRVDCLIDGIKNADYVIRHRGYQDKIRMAFISASDPNRIAFSKKSKYKTLLPKINRIISDMKQDGSLGEIVNAGY